MINAEGIGLTELKPKICTRAFRKAWAQPYTVNSRTITVDKNAAYPNATAEMKKVG